jgi:hypothetical protein
MVVLVNLTSVQNYLAKQASEMLSNKLRTKVTIAHVRIDFLNHFLVQGLYIEDQAHDTLLYAGEARVRISDWFIFRQKPVLHYIALENTFVHLHRTGNSDVWNFDFIANAFITGKKDTSTGKPFEFDLKMLNLENVRVHIDDPWEGLDMHYDVGAFALDAKNLDFKKELIDLSNIDIKNTDVSIVTYKMGKPRRSHPNDTFDTTPFNPDKWKVQLKELALDNCTFHLKMNDEIPVPNLFDENHLDVKNIGIKADQISIVGDTIRGNVKGLTAQERCGIAIKKMRSRVTVSPIASICENLYLETKNSKVKDYYAMHYKRFPDFTDYIDSVVMVGNLKDAVIDKKDIEFFAPQLKALPEVAVHISGSGKGTVTNLSGHHLNVTDGNSVVKGNITIKGLPDVYKTYFNYTDGEIITTGAGILRYTPFLKNNASVSLESITYAFFKGSYEGYLENFSVNGTLNTNLGSLTTSVKMDMPGFNSNTVVYSGSVAANNVQAGVFLKQPLLGNITLKEDFSGRSFAQDQAQLKVDGFINELSINKYPYRNITTHGILAKKEFDGKLLVDDPNLALEFDGLFNYSDKNVHVKATAHLLNCNFKAINVTTDSITASADFDLNCTGSNIDNFSGYAKLNNISLKRNNHKLAIDSVLVNSSGSNGEKELNVQSNDLAVDIKGDYQLSKLPASFQYYLSQYIPNYIQAPAKLPPYQKFDFVVTTAGIDSILAVTIPIVRGFDSSTISGSLNTSDQKLTLNANVPYGSIGKFHLSKIVVTGQGNQNLIGLNTTIDNVAIGDSFINGSLSVTTTLGNDSVAFNIATTTPDPSSSITLNGHIIARKDSLFLTVLPSQFYLNQVKWDINGGSRVVYSKNYLLIQNLSIISGLQRITAATEMAGKDKRITIATENLDLGQLSSFAGFAAYQPEGRLNGTITIDKIFDGLYVAANIKATGVLLGADTVGTINIIGNYDGAKKLVSLDPQTGIYKDDASVIASGNISFDSTTHQKLDGIIKFNNTPVVWASPFLVGIMSHLSGNLNGDVNVGGSSFDPIIKGAVTLERARFHIDYMGCNYSIPLANIHVDNKTISFGNVLIFDAYKNTATLSGHFAHNLFKDMRMRLSIRSKKFEVMNLTSADNNIFYGNAIASMDSFTIRGPFNNISLKVYNAVPVTKSRIYLPVVSGGDIGTYSYVSFKTYGKTQEKVVRKNKFKIHINIDANLNTLAEMHIVLDPSTGDEIMARGDGRIQLDIPSDNDMQILGLYLIDNGTYKLTFKSLFIQRQFKLNQGSQITFNGPFSETDLNVDAAYAAKAKLSDLLSETDLKTLAANPNEIKDAQTPQWINVMLHMSGSLKSPRLTFDLDLEDKHSQSSYAYRKLMLINNDDRQKTEEVVSLLLISSFIPPEGIGGGAVASGAVNNVSQILSSSMSTGLTSIVNKITGDKQLNIDVKYTNYNYNDQALGGVNRSQVKVVASKNYFNDRLDLEFGGTSDWGRPTSGAASTSNYINVTGDFRIQYKLSYAGGLRLNAFRTSDYDAIKNSDITRTGVGISWRKSFDNFGDFFRGNKYSARQAELAEQNTNATADTTAKHAGGIE